MDEEPVTEDERKPMTQEDKMAWLASRKEIGLKIDPETAEVEWWYARTVDPYGIFPEEEGESCVGREYFAFSPEGEIVSFDDLP
jgi:hypothetical protein